MAILMAEILNDFSDGHERRAIYTMFNKIFNNDSTTTNKAIIFGAAAAPISVAGAFTTGISISADGTTAISVTSGFSGTTGFLFNGTATNGISLTGACSTAAISITGAEAVGILIATSTPTSGISITAACASGLAVTGACTTAAIQMGVSGTTAGDFVWYGTTALYKVTFDADGDTNGSVILGADTKGIDLTCYGLTTGNYLQWDNSVDDLLLVGTATQLGVAGTTDASSATTGSIHTAGGVGIEKALWVGTTSRLVGVVTSDVGIIISANDMAFSGSLDSAAVADEVSIGGYEIGAGARSLSISQENAVVAETDETKFSDKLPVRINGTTYYIMLTVS